MSLRRTTLCCFIATAALVAGCDRSPPFSPAPTGDAQTQQASTGVDAGHGNGYAYHIRYPQPAVDSRALADALRIYAAAAKKDFLDASGADSAANSPPHKLDLEFTVARRTSDFVGVLARGSMDTGGAHPMPLLASFNLHTGDDKVIALTDLFADADAALKALSEEARRQLEGRADATLRDTAEDKRADELKRMHEWIERGTGANAENFRVFLVDGIDAKAIGLTLLFPPYQVAPYSDGAQQIEVPAKVFYALLKPEYRDAFIIDTEAPAQRTH